MTQWCLEMILSKSCFVNMLFRKFLAQAQVVYNGVASGTMHLKAKVIRNLTNLFGVDCIAGQKLYKVLTSAAPNLDSSVASKVSPSASMVTEENDEDICFQ